MKIAVVRLDGNLLKNFEFKTDLDLKAGDKVVCDTVNGLVVGKIVALQDEPSSEKLATKWVVDKIDLTAHLARKEKEEKLKDIKSKMDKRRKKLEDIIVFEMLAEKDDEMAQLLWEYNSLR